MALAIRHNTTCDIYRYPNAPPAAPATAGVRCFLIPDWPRGQDAGDRGVVALTWTHIMLFDSSVDIRDMYTGQSTMSMQDTVWVPDQNGTRFNVIFVELVQRGTAHAHKRVYLDRQQPTWPTNEL
jgi:hypothetical protein